MHLRATTAGDSWLAEEVPLLVVAPTVPRGARVASSFNHNSLLRTAEQLLGLSPLAGAATSAPSMVTAFNL